MDIIGTLGFILSVLVGLFILVFLVVIHELGHAIVARRNGVVVEEFGIGFPPRAWAKKLKNGMLLTLNWLPLGGFVKLQGETESDSKNGDYGAASYWVKTKILLAGVTINWLLAAIIFTLISLFGIPKIIPNQFQIKSDSVETLQPVTAASVTAGSPAEKAGIKQGDQLLLLNGQQIKTTEDLFNATKTNKGKTVEIVYSRGSSEASTKAMLNNDNKGQGYLGVGPNQQTTLRSTWSAPIVGVGTAVQFSWVTLQGLGDVVVRFFGGLASQLNFNGETRQAGGEKLSQLSNEVAGPIGILGVLFPSAQEAGLIPLLLITALISLTLAIMNILPIPALDGGRWFLMTLFRIMKKPLTKEREEAINAAGFAALMILVVLITVSDVKKFF